MKTIRDRIVELRRVPASQLRRHPQNWRVHPDRQRSAMTDVLHEVGYADALIARQLSDGSLELIDGHLRAETTPDAEVPVLIVDLDEREAALLLAVHDPLAAMAETDDAMLRELLAGVDMDRTRIDRLMNEVVGELAVDVLADVADRPTLEPLLTDLYQVAVECRDEAEQRELYQRLTAEGRRCRVLTL